MGKGPSGPNFQFELALEFVQTKRGAVTPSRRALTQRLLMAGRGRRGTSRRQERCRGAWSVTFTVFAVRLPTRVTVMFTFALIRLRRFSSRSPSERA